MDFEIARRGMMLGFAVAAPVGPIGVIVIRRSLAHGVVSGVASGLGAAVSDAAFALAGALGLAAAGSAIVGSFAFRFVGAVILGYLGVRTLREKPADPTATASSERPSHPRAFASVFALTMANPATILSFAAAFAALGGGIATRASAFAFASSVLAGSMVWWVTLSAGVSALRTRLSQKALRAINVGSGLVLVGFAVMSLLRR